MQTAKEIKRVKPKTDEVKLITDIRDLLFSRFIKCAGHHDYSQLIEQGEPSKEQLEEAWLKILSQYYREVGNSHMDKYTETKGVINHLEARKARITANIGMIRFVLAVCQTPPEEIELLYKELRAEGYDMAFTPETIEADLKRIEIEELNNEYTLRKLKKEEESLSTVTTQESSTEERLISSLFDINKHEGATYKAHEITVQEYCYLYKRLEKAIHKQNVKNIQHGR